jgi:hypothetical protein
MRYMHACINYIHVINSYLVIGYFHNIHVHCNHRHLRNIDCFMARNACLVCSLVLSTATAKKERKEAYYEWR